MTKRNVPREFQFFFSKLVWEDEGLTVDEVVILMDLFLRFDDLVSRDWNYRVWLKPLQEATTILRNLQAGQSKTFGLKERFLRADRCITGLILDPHAYFGLKNQNRPGAARLITCYPKRRRPQAKRFIGVGYRDKGNLRITSYDGHPNWSEVAADERMRAIQRWSPFGWSALGDRPQGIAYGPNWGSRNLVQGSLTVQIKGHTEEYVI